MYTFQNSKQDLKNQQSFSLIIKKLKRKITSILNYLLYIVHCTYFKNCIPEL